MRLISVNVGLPRELEVGGRAVTTSIWKSPVEGRVRVGRLNIEGDRQSDLSVHGGPEKAVYAYPSEHYEFWRRELGTDWPWGAFGENLTIEGRLEGDVQIGDHLRVGSALFRVTQPRMPCYKLGIRFNREEMIRLFLQSGRSGFYLAVVEEGDVAAGDSIEVAQRSEYGITVADFVAAYRDDPRDPDLLRRILELPDLPGRWRDYFGKHLM